MLLEPECTPVIRPAHAPTRLAPVLSMRSALLEWFRPRRFAYPWRSDPPDPYRVLVSEVMLQQTQAARVAPAFSAFVSQFPTVQSLAAASKAEVLRTWSGLGYNRRAVALHDAARLVMRDHDGTIPSDPEVLVRLPGIGPYTAAAVASIGFGLAVPALDSNARRVVCRAVLGVEPSVVPNRIVEETAGDWLDRADPATWNQAVMDLGREACRTTPRCDRCPLRHGCRFVGERPAKRRARQPRFEGSMRQVRGAVMRAVLDRSPATIAQLGKVTGFAADRIGAAVNGLCRDGLVSATRGALAGNPAGRVRLPE